MKRFSFVLLVVMLTVPALAFGGKPSGFDRVKDQAALAQSLSQNNNAQLQKLKRELEQIKKSSQKDIDSVFEHINNLYLNVMELDSLDHEDKETFKELHRVLEPRVNN